MSDTNVNMNLVKAELNLAEQLVRAKYPHLRIVEGSMVQETAHPVYGNKRRVRVQCPHCDVIVERATSDLFTFKGCPACLRLVRRAEKVRTKLLVAQALAAEAAKAESEGEA